LHLLANEAELYQTMNFKSRDTISSQPVAQQVHKYSYSAIYQLCACITQLH